MDKKFLNNEIVLCRPSVRKARVVVIRKLLKKMKILKTCKVDALKDKKLKKAERLFKKVQIMKKLKDDDVTKFALKNLDLEVFLKGPKIDLHKSALARLAKHKAVTKHVNAIRERIPNWEVELPILLDSLGKKKLKKSKPKNAPVEEERKKESLSKRVKMKPKQLDENPGENISEISEKISKIDDPFFIKKKVIAPKLVLKSMAHDVNKSVKIRPKRETKCRFKPENENQLKETQPVEKEKTLHPSWAAKKVNMIKPFQGKKTMFSDD